MSNELMSLLSSIFGLLVELFTLRDKNLLHFDWVPKRYRFIRISFYLQRIHYNNLNIRSGYTLNEEHKKLHVKINFA